MNFTKIKTDLVLATGGAVLEKLAGYVVLMVLTRYLAPDRMGQFFFAATVCTFFASLTSLGTGRQLTRVVAEDPQNALRHLGEVLSLRLPLTGVALIVLNVGTRLARPDLADVMLFTSLYVLIGDLEYAFASLFIGLRRVGVRLAAGLVGPALLIVLVLVAVEYQASFDTILLCYVVSSIVVVAVLVGLVRGMFGRIHLQWDPQSARRLVAVSWPFFVLLILGTLQFKVDTVMIWFIMSDAAVARYETAYKLLEVTRLLVRPASMVFLPIFSAMAVKGDWRDLGIAFRRLYGVAGVAGVAIALVVVSTSGALMPLIWGPEYRTGAPILRVLYLTVPALYLGFIGSFMASALHLEKRLLRIMTIALTVNVGLNTIAIPAWGEVGAAWTTLATETLLTVWMTAVIFSTLRERARAQSRTASPAAGEAASVDAGG